MMLKKIVIPLLLCLILALASCSSPDSPADNPQDNVSETESKNTIIEEESGTPSDYTPIQNLYIVSGKMNSLDSYTFTVTGSVKAKLGFTVNQTVNDSFWKNGSESFSQTVSTSTMVNNGYQIFSNGESVVVREADNPKKMTWKNAFNSMTESEFKSEFGLGLLDLTNYTLNDETIISSELISNENGLYTFKYMVDINKGTAQYKVKMKKFGDLSNAPVFSLCEFTLVCDEYWNPVKISQVDNYEVKYGILGNADCKSNIVRTFADIGGNVEIPNAALFRQHI